MKQLLIPILLCSSIFCLGQKKIDITDSEADPMSFFNVVNGEPVSFARFAKVVDGSPYFNKDWLKGSLTLSLGKEYSNLFLKLNLVDNEVHYRDAKGNELIAVTPMKRVVLTDTLTKHTYTFVNLRYFLNTNSQKDEWYQVLSEGNATVLKDLHKTITESTPYGSGVIEQRIISVPRYYVIYNNQLIQTKKLKDIPDIFPERKADLSKYISEKKLNGRTDDDFVSVISYYNSLK